MMVDAKVQIYLFIKNDDNNKLKKNTKRRTAINIDRQENKKKRRLLEKL